MRKLLIILILTFFVNALKAGDVQISVLTCAEGKEIYASFGHCAFRIVDKEKHIDKVYNYGTFSYKQPYFVLKFVKGFLNYSLSAYPYYYFEKEYTRDGRKVREQVLNLNEDEKRALYDFLEWNALEENRYYKYNFLEDNCSTKIRDILKKVCKENIVFPEETYDFSLRDQINVRIKEMPWFRLGVSLLMGLPVDKKADSYTIQFLPDYIYLILNQTFIKHGGELEKIVAKENVLVDVKQPVNKTDFTTYCSPLLVFSLVFAILAVVTFYEVKNGKYNALIDRILLIIVGLFGILFFVMWFFTEHTVTAWNLNILWANPLHIVAAFMVKKKDGFWNGYFKATACLTAIMLVFGWAIPQQYDVAFYPIIATILLRLVRIAFCKK